MAADTFSYRSNGLFFDVYNVRTGLVEVELVDCIGEVRNWIAELTAKAIEEDAAEQAALDEQHADYMAECEMLDAIYADVKRRRNRALPESHPHNRAVSLALEAIDAIGRPIVEEMARAA